mgnify:FL=1
MHDTWFLSQKSEKATKADSHIAQDLLDTLKAHEEGCLSLIGIRKCTRYEEIEVEYEDMGFRRQRATFKGWTAQIIQHECDHLEGILI